MVLICVLFENLQALRDAFGPGTADRALNDVAALLKGCCRGGWERRSLQFLAWMPLRRARR
jgi:GGDEF domain-containing protein